MADDTNTGLGDDLNLDEAALALDGLQDEPEARTEPEQDADAEEPLEGDDAPEAEDGDEDEPETPAIDPPASLNAEEKARFAQLPPEAQRMLADVEVRRARQVTEATTKAADAQREAKAEAQRATLEAKQTFAHQLTAFAAAYQPRQPNPADYDDMQQYARDHAQWQYAAAQHGEIMQQVRALGEEATGEADQYRAQAAQAEAGKLRQALPEWFDAEKGPKLKEDLTSVGSELGYSPELMAQADAGDILALNKALVWKRKAERLDAIVARQMKGVRAAKTAQPGTSRPQGTGRKMAAQEATARVAKTGSIDDAAAAIAALGR